MESAIALSFISFPPKKKPCASGKDASAKAYVQI